jgi:hypothetical protein
MKRRHFLQTASVSGILSLSGCSQINPLSDKTDNIPTDAQLEQIEFYPYYEELGRTARVLFTRKRNEVQIDPLVFGPFRSFEIYQIKQDGTGEKLRTMSEGEEFSKLYPLSITQNGSLALVIGVTDDNTKYTYGAFYYTGDTFEQVAYMDLSPTETA